MYCHFYTIVNTIRIIIDARYMYVLTVTKPVRIRCWLKSTMQANINVK